MNSVVGAGTSRPNPSAVPGFDVHRIREDFPVLHQEAYDRPLIYLDNAATTQKPRAVIDAISHYYARDNANVHRGVHLLSQRATDAHEGARSTVRAFLNAGEIREIVFTRGATESINLVASSYAGARLQAGDEIVISGMEHHSNIVPWQMVCERTGAELRVVPITDDGELRLEGYARLLTDRTRLVAVVHVSNALGTVNPVGEMIRMAHDRGVPVLLDGAQAAPHVPVDVQALDCDFYAFSGHKVYGPTGIGVLYGKAEHLEAMPPYQGGGDMIRTVSFEETTYNELPYKFEAGTPHIAGAVGLGAALEYVQGIGLDTIERHERELLTYATEVVEEIEGIRLIGTARDRAGVLSFDTAGIHPHDVGTVLDREGIAVRAGHHCAQPVMQRFGLAATTRASFAIYNTWQEIEALGKGLHKVVEVLG